MILSGMDQHTDLLAALLLRLKAWDRSQVLAEARELRGALSRQVFNQIPAVSTLAALGVAAWVGSTFTTSPWRARFARWGFIKGGRNVVSSEMHHFLVYVLPVIVAAIVAYTVQRVLKRVREQQLQRNMAAVAQLEAGIQAQIAEKLAILEKAQEAGLISPAEFLTKKANLYATYGKVLPVAVKELLMSKLAN
jgi:hypothetical protein